MMLKKEGGRRERDREIPYTLPYLDLLLKKKIRTYLVYIVITLFLVCPFQASMPYCFWMALALKKSLRKTV